jgi:hypothetical protein
MYGRGLAPVVLVALLASVSPARAQNDEADEEEDYYSRRGAYFQALFTNNVGGYDFPKPFDGDALYSPGVGGAFGYRIHEHVAAEIFGDWVSCWDLSAGGVDFGDAVAGAIGINGKGFLNGGRFQPYALVGLGAAYADVVRASQAVPGVFAGSGGMGWDMAVRVGLGFDWYATEEVGFSFSPMYVLPVGIGDDLTELQYWAIGVGAFLRFGE